MNFGMTILRQSMETAKLCYTDTDSFIIYIRTEDFFEDISNDVERWFDKNDKRLLPIGKNKKVPGLFYAYVIIDGYDDDYEKK